MTDAPLTLTDVLSLAQLDGAMGKHIIWLDNGRDSELQGTLRHFCAEDGSSGYVHPGQDIRDTFVRITTDMGWEIWRPTMQMAKNFHDGKAMVDR